MIENIEVTIPVLAISEEFLIEKHISIIPEVLIDEEQLPSEIEISIPKEQINR